MLPVVILLSLCAIILAISYICYRIAFHSPANSRETIAIPPRKILEAHGDAIARALAALEKREYEEVFTSSREGLRLAGKYYHVQPGAPLVIAFHGYRSSSFTDFAAISALCFRMGMNLLLVDQRGRGSSEGKAITFGILEREDCVAWCRFARERFGVDCLILLYGISMGATTVLMASELALPENVKGIAADCPYSSPAAIIRSVSDHRHYPTALLYPFVALGARLFGHFSLDRRCTAARAVRSARVPILIFHGEADNFVPAAMSEEIALACPGKIRRETFPGASHGISVLVDEARYRRILGEFAGSLFGEKFG